MKRLKLKKYLKQNKGTAIIEYIVIAVVASLLAIAIIPSLNEAVENRQEKTIEYYNGTDTITELD